MDEYRKEKSQRRIRGFAILLLLLVGINVFYPIAALAVPVEATIVADPKKEAEAVITETVQKPFLVALFGIVVNFVTFLSNRIAYDAAVALATAGNGEEPLINLDEPTEFQIGLAEDIAGAAIDMMSESLEAVNIHFNICAPQAPAARLVLQLGIKSAFERPKPKCDFQNFVSNWQGFVADSFGDDHPDQFLLANFAQAINPRTTDLTAGIALYTDIIDDAKLNQSIGFAKYLADHGYKDVSDVITGTVKTPSSVVEDTWKKSLPNDNQAQNRGTFFAMLQMKDLWKQLGLSVLSTFTNTLLSKFTERIYGGLFDVKIEESDPFDVASVGFQGGVEAAEAHFRTIFTFTPTKLDTYSIITEFVTCAGTTTRQLDTCVMDANFATAVGGADSANPFTVQEAIDEGLISGSYPLIGPTDSRNIDQNCYTYGFCYANLVRMRLARVIPVGWEMAAELQSGSSTDTLQTVIDAFDDVDSQYYHLIDPNWVLKYPTSQCNANMAGQLVADDGSNRGMECVDAPSCIQEDASGACVGGYGYCAREANSWNFRGTDCPEQYATCLAFDNGSGATGNWLLNTADTEGCNADNAGCLWYSTQKEADDEGEFNWPTIDDLPTVDASNETYLSRLYFNNNVEECDSADAGCTRVIEKTSDVALNGILNPSFETDDDTDDLPDYWTLTGASSYSADAGTEQFGTDAVLVGDTTGTTGGVYQTALPIQQSMFYTLSYYAAQTSSSGTTQVALYATFASEDGSEDVDLSGTSYETDNCVIIDSDTDGKKETLVVAGTPATDSYERFTCTFTSPTLSDANLGLRIKTLRLTAKGLYVDGVQLEAGEDVSDYREGYGADVSEMDPQYFKLPPTYLGCTGDSTVDPESCADFAPVCSAQDVGCELYTPVNGDPTVPGIANDLDECPSTCSGYDAFKQEATTYEPNGVPAVYFIPSTAVDCSEQYVGCDEFTNLNDESLEYYTYLRACLTTAQTSDEANYYTWEGSDLEGFQLKSWALLKSNLSSSDTVNYTESGVASDSDAGAAPCTIWQATSSGIVCQDDSPTMVDDDDCNEHDDIFTEPDCREFYDANGNIHYRRFTETVTISDVCADYRKTDTVGDDAAEKESNCTDSGGYWNATIGECRFYGLPEESTDCPASFNGCREYTGGTGRNSSIVYSDDVEDEDVDEYVISNADAEVSNESVATDGHSMHITATAAGGYLAVAEASLTSICTDSAGCEASAGTLGFTCTVDENASDCGELVDELASEKTYVLSFWAKGLTSGVVLTPKFIEEGGSGTARSFGAVTLSANWEQYTVGPLDTTTFTNFDDTAELAFALGSSANQVYLDNITLRQTEEQITVVKDSWNTPAECDETPEGASSPQYYLGCQEYSDSAGDAAYLKSFTRLCSEEKVGCAAFYDTESSDSPYGAVYSMTCAGAYTEDSTTYNRNNSIDYIWPSSGTCTIDGVDYCEVEVGHSSCQFDVAEGMIPHLTTGRLPFQEQTAFSPATFLKLTPDVNVVPADNLTYFVADSEFSCDTEFMGCTEVGLPTMSADQSRVASWTDTYLLNTVEDYADTLCSHDALFCDAWDTTQDGTYYFKNPETKTCEYRTGVSINATDYTGWFRTGTDQFCYGTGTCSVSGVSCEIDADCTGSTDSETDSCEIDAGTYLIGGTASGIWRNGDVSADGTEEDDYTGWVGGCSAQYDLCSEFVDPLDVDQDAGEFYTADAGASSFFLNNDLLDESNLATSKRCDGQVSQKKGCVLFENTTNAELNYNASASYNLSVHADQFYSDSVSYALVDPISCPDNGEYTALDGTTYDLCTTRCAYLSENLHPYESYATAEGVDLYTFTTSCLIDADCPVVKSDGGDAVTGTCELSTFTGTDGAEVTVPSLEDDTNEIQKVNLDRACAEWMACNSSTKVWDENQQAFVNVCDSIGLCNEYSSLGETTTCSNWVVDAVPSVLTTDEYAGRDVSWYGHDYAGFSIPGTVLASHLSQENVNPARWCVETASDGVSESVPEGEDLPYIDCSEDDSICDDVTPSGEGATVACGNAEEDFRLVFDAGMCDPDTTANGDECTIGFCDDNGAPCATSSDCNTDVACQTGYCYYGAVWSACTTDSECTDPDFPVCSSIDGVCERRTSDGCVSSSDCADGDGAIPACETAVKTQTGMCVSGSCLANPVDDNSDGKLDAFSFDDAEELVCRGWPETKSPFGNEVVSTWVDSANPGDPGGTITDSDDQPYQILSTFDNVNICAGGQSCSCTYDEVQYGGGSTMYFDQGAESAPPYVCVGGNYDGAECNFNSLGVGQSMSVNGVTICEDGGGICTRISSDQTKVGLQGFCLQRDTALTMNGDQNQAPCLAWLPIDRAAGATDIYGKSIGAGYGLQDTYYCAEPAMYVDIKPSYVSSGDGVTACAEKPTASGDCQPDDYDDANNVACPDDFFALAGKCMENDGTVDALGSLAAGCFEPFTNATASTAWFDGDNDYPYICIPNNSFMTDDGSVNGLLEGDSCEGPKTQGDYDISSAITSDYGTPVYWVQNTSYEAFDDYVEDYSLCIRRGVEYTSTLVNTDHLGFAAKIENSGDGYKKLYMQGEIYPGCKTVVQVTDTTENAAWTNRLMFEDDPLFSLSDTGAPANLGYMIDTAREKFGISDVPSNRSEIPTDPYPIVIASCIDQPADQVVSEIEDLEGSCPAGGDNEGEDCVWDLDCPDGEGGYDACDGGSGGAISIPFDGSLMTYSTFAFGLPNDDDFTSCSDVGSDAVAPSMAGNGDPESRSFVGLSMSASADDIYEGFGYDGDTLSDGLSRLNELFATIGSTYTYNDDGGAGYGEYGLADTSQIWQSTETISDSSIDVRDTGGNGPASDLPSAPIVRSVSSTCVGSYCREGDDNKFSVNGEDSTDQTGASTFFADVKFFVEANANQMPIRRVIVDWADENNGNYTGSQTDDNYYKNRRGLTPANKQWCDDGRALNWGETTSACDSNFFNAQHYYTCSQGLIDTLDTCSMADGQLETSPCTQGGYGNQCVFQPRVHIRDNWGWCTGSCPNSYTGIDDDVNGGAGCFDGGESTFDSTNTDNECELDRPHTSSDQKNEDDPWVYYDGVITIEP